MKTLIFITILILLLFTPNKNIQNKQKNNISQNNEINIKHNSIEQKNNNFIINKENNDKNDDDNNDNNNNYYYKETNTKNNKSKLKIGKIEIEKLKINENLYQINSQENNIDKHITILKESIMPEKENSIVFIAAHSGTGKIAYFKNLDHLQKGDIIKLTINNKTYFYNVKEKWEKEKDGFINITKDKEKQLILTTCSPNNKKKQLIVNCIEKESIQ